MDQYADNQQATVRKRRSDLVGQLRAGTQQGIFQGPVGQAPLTQHRTENNMPGFRAHGPYGTMQPVGQPRAIDTPAFPVDNRQLVTPRSPEQALADRTRSNYSMAQTYTGQHYPTDNPASFGNRDNSDPGGPVLGRSREDLIRARGANDPDYDMEKFLARNTDRLADLQGRRELRKRRGIEKGEARHQAQVQAMQGGAMLPAHLRGQGGMNPMVAMAMRNPSLAIEMAKLQQMGALEAQRLGLQGKGLTLQERQVENDRLLAMQKAELEGKLTNAQVAKIENSMDPEVQNMEIFRELGPELAANDPTFARQMSERARGAFGITPTPAGATPPAIPDPETGIVPAEQVDRILAELVNGQNLEGEALLAALEANGVPRSQAQTHLLENKPGMLSYGGDLLSYLFTTPGNFNNEELRIRHKNQPFDRLQKAFTAGQ